MSGQDADTPAAMNHSTALTCLIIILLSGNARGQATFIRTKEGRPILNRMDMIMNCLHSLHKDRSDETALSICQCQIDKLDNHFTNKQYRKHSDGTVIDVSGLINEDSLFRKEIQECYDRSGKTILLQAEGFESEFVERCIKSIQETSEKKADPGRLRQFCSCQLEMVKTQKLTDAEMRTLANPNSLLFYEVLYKCEDPFAEDGKPDENWTEQAVKDLNGPPSDTVRLLTLHGMTYVKIKTGSQWQVWLLDTGASDLLINTDMEADLKKESIITAAGYLGTGEYEMANGSIDTCRKYRIDHLQIGQFTVNNVIVAVTDKGKKIVAGKALLNKFGSYMLDNRKGVLILNK